MPRRLTSSLFSLVIVNDTQEESKKFSDRKVVLR